MRIARLSAVCAAVVAAAIAAPAAGAAQSMTLHGSPTADGCRFTSTLRLAPGQASASEREQSFDAASCTLVVSRSASASPAGSAASSQAGAYVHSAGYQRTVWVNQNNIAESTSKSLVDWLWNGSSVTSATCGHNFTALSFWTLTGASWPCSYTHLSTGKAAVLSHVTAQESTRGFCPTGALTQTNVANNAYGVSNGSLVGTYTFTKSGACLSSLFFRHSLVRTLN